MLIDDSQIDRFVSSAVIRHYNFAENVIECSDATDALDHLKALYQAHAELPVIIFLDINMPIMNGFDFLDHFIHLPGDLVKRCTIVMLSSTNASKDFEKMKAYPIIRMFFHKPLTDKILDDIRKFEEKLSFRTLFF